MEDLWERIIQSKPGELRKHPRGAKSQQLLHVHGKPSKRYLPLKLSNLNITNRVRAQ